MKIAMMEIHRKQIFVLIKLEIQGVASPYYNSSLSICTVGNYRCRLLYLSINQPKLPNTYCIHGLDEIRNFFMYLK